jgi:putative transcriptional regulator
VVIVNRIRDVADQRGVNVKALSERAGITYNTALNLYRGVVTRIDLEVLDKVCMALEAQPGDLLVRIPDEKPA